MKPFQNLKDLLSKATPGKWCIVADQLSVEVKEDHWRGLFTTSSDKTKFEEEKKLNMFFIVEAHNQLPALLEAYEALKKERDEAMMSAGYSNPDHEPLIETIKKLRADLKLAVDTLSRFENLKEEISDEYNDQVIIRCELTVADIRSIITTLTKLRIEASLQNSGGSE